MSQLSDLINKYAEQTNEGFDATAAAPLIWAELDEEQQKLCGIQEIIRRLKDAADRFAKKAVKAILSSQMDLPFDDLPGAVALDIDGRSVKAFTSLSKFEFERVRAMRKKQLQDDKRALDALDAFEIAARPFWSTEPDLTCGEVIKAVMASKRAA